MSYSSLDIITLHPDVIRKYKFVMETSPERQVLYRKTLPLKSNGRTS